MTGLSIGIDFGTTNTVVALAGADGPAHLVKFPAPEKEVFAFRSALSFHSLAGPDGRPSERVIEAGPWAIEAYVEDPLETSRLRGTDEAASRQSPVNGSRLRLIIGVGAPQ